MPSRVGALIALFALAAPGLARAESSGGAGGPRGETDDAPCAGCVTVTPDDAGPWPLLVTFHGDEGDPSYIHGAFREVAPAAGFLLVSLRCPRDRGCGGSWWRWEASGSHDDFAWALAQIDAVEAAYPVDRDRVYVAGFSGGSSYLSELVPRHTDRIAGALYLGGGYRPYGVGCAACAVPIHFVIGDRDFLLDGAMDLRGFYESCDHDVDWQLVSGVDHQIVESRLPAVLDAMRSGRHPCRASAPPPMPDAGSTDAGPSIGVDAGLGSGLPDAARVWPDAGPPDGPRELALVGECSVGPRGSSGWLAVVLPCAVLLLRRRGALGRRRVDQAGPMGAKPSPAGSARPLESRCSRSVRQGLARRRVSLEGDRGRGGARHRVGARER